MTSIFTSMEMTCFSSGDNAVSMGILDDALRKMKVVAEREYGSLSAFAREAGENPNLVTRWYKSGKDGSQARKPTFGKIAPLLEKLGFTVATKEELSSMSCAQERAKIAMRALDLMRERGVDEQTVFEVSNILLTGYQTTPRRLAATKRSPKTGGAPLQLATRCNVPVQKSRAQLELVKKVQQK